MWESGLLVKITRSTTDNISNSVHHIIQALPFLYNTPLREPLPRQQPILKFYDMSHSISSDTLRSGDPKDMARPIS